MEDASLRELLLTRSESRDHLCNESLLQGIVILPTTLNDLLEYFVVTLLIEGRQDEVSSSKVTAFIGQLSLVLRLVVHFVVFWVEHFLHKVAHFWKESAVVTI